MPGKIFISYRRDDDPGNAARVRDGLAQRFGKANLFMDVDNLLAGRRFDEELAKALSSCDVLIAVLGTQWVELLKAKSAAGERDYVVEEIGEALTRRIPVIPVRVGREGKLAPLPRADELPEAIRDLMYYQKHDVVHEHFGQNIAALGAAVATLRQSRGGGTRSIGWAAAVAALLGIGYAGAGFSGLPLPGFPTWQGPAADATKQRSEAENKRLADAAAQARQDAETKPRAEQEAKTQAEAEVQSRVEAAAQAQRNLEARQKAESDARARIEAERVRQSALLSVETNGMAAAQRDPALAVIPGSGQSFRDCDDGCPEMVVAPSGTFTMGSPSNEEGHESFEEPQHTVTIREPFAIGKFEVTRAEFAAFVSSSGHRTDGGCYAWTGSEWRSQTDKSWTNPGFSQTDRDPVVCVNWHDAKAYATWMSRKTGKPYRLLTESEWEYAARAGATTPFSTGRTITTSQANFNGRYTYGGSNKGVFRIRTVEVGSFRANAFGLHDMHGNAWEWVEDCWHDSYNGAPSTGTAWTTACTNGGLRGFRGGSWSTFPAYLRLASRGRDVAGHAYSKFGFRIGRSISTRVSATSVAPGK